MLLASSEDSERQITDQARSIDRDCDISQGQEKDHDVYWLNIVYPYCAIVHFPPADSKDSQEKQVGYQRCLGIVSRVI